MGFYPCFLAYPLIYKPIAGDGTSTKRIYTVAIVSVVIALQLGAFSVVLETLSSGRSELPFGTFVLLMQPIHLAIGLVEGIITAGIISYVKKVRPEIIEASNTLRPLNAGISLKNILAAFVILAVVTGGALSWFASTHPDGLEWSIQKVTGKQKLTEQTNSIASLLRDIQEKTAFLPDYNFKPYGKDEPKKQKTPSWPGIEAGTSVAGIVGGAIVLMFILFIGFEIRRFKKL
jgi:cobalt/nickel transport system permease protein